MSDNKLSVQVDQRLLQTLVPVNALTVDHLGTLLRDQTIEVLCSGQGLFEKGDYDNQHVYLLSGEIKIIDQFGLSKILSADDPMCRYPLYHCQPRELTIVAESDCHVIRFNSDLLDAMLAWDQASRYIILDIASQRDLDEDADWMITLLKSNLFYKVPPMNIRQILNKFTPKYVSSGEIIIRQGEIGDCCYFIKEGHAGVYQSVDDRTSSEQVAELGVGRCFGEDALVNAQPRNATIVMKTNGVLMRLDKQDFYLLLKSPTIKNIELEKAMKAVPGESDWVDVRTQDEYEKGHCDMAVNMPLDLLKLKSRMLDKQRHYIIYCNSGRRSEAATYLLSQDGFNVSMLASGMDSYSKEQQAASGILQL